MPDDDLFFDGWLHEHVGAHVQKMLPRMVAAEIRRRATEQQQFSDLGMCVCQTCGTVLESHQTRRSPTIAEIVAAVALETGVTAKEIRSARRSARTAWARMIAVYLSSKATNATHPMLGRAFDRDPTTIGAAIRTVAAEVQGGTARGLLATRLLFSITNLTDEPHA